MSLENFVELKSKKVGNKMRACPKKTRVCLKELLMDKLEQFEQYIYKGPK